MASTIVWFRNDLRIADNPALDAAMLRGGPVVFLFIWSPDEDSPWQLGSASRWWLKHSLSAFEEDLASRGAKLIVRTGKSLDVLKEVIHQTGADAVYFSRLYESHAIRRDEKVTLALRKDGITVETFNANLLIEPWKITNTSGMPYRVFTPYWNRCLKQLAIVETVPVRARRINDGSQTIPSTAIEKLALDVDTARTKQLESCWKPGASSAQRTLQNFLHDMIFRYPENRDQLDLIGTSVLSPHLHFGEISPRQIWASVVRLTEKSKKPGVAKACQSYLRQLVWREFAYYLLYHFPESSSKPLQAKFASFPWQRDKRLLKYWKEGNTGYPIVDAGMRQLSQTGWISNRMRMIVASFLVKDLLQPWQEGARWFWETLVDADLANNTLGWQWVAGCGADAAPFFRIFNPESQAKKFDPNGEYVSRWLPESKRMPIIDHDVARQHALDIFHSL